MTELIVDVAPFDLPGAGRAAALCLHGLTGTPYEVRSLGQALAAAGIRAVGPALPGHNESARALARVSQTQWVEAARTRLRELRREHDAVFAVGLSMGGLVTLLLGAEEDVDGLVAVGTPLRLRGLAPRLVPIVKHVVPFLRKSRGSDIADEKARARHPSLDAMPLASVHELMHLQRRVVAALPRVRAPILVAHGALDRTAHPDDAREILRSVSSSLREHLVLDDSAHVVPVDRDGPRLASAVAAFLGERLGG